MRLLLCCCLFLPFLCNAQSDSLPPLPRSFEKPMDYRPKALGTLSYAISSKETKAQTWFDQGIQLKYAFAVDDAARSFREAWKIDSTCAICYWGEAWALGAYLNGKLSKKKSPHALKAIRTAKSLAKDFATDKERALIDAMLIRYVEDFDPDSAAIQDTAYAKAMQKVYEAYPEDLDIATVYAEALFLLEPRRGTRELDDPDVMRIHQVLEKVLEADITHPGACHLYIHATESTPAPQKALPCAEYMGTSIPGASHLNHMPSHAWNEVGMWGEAVRANLRAVQSDKKAKFGEGFAIYPAHNLHMLLYAASMDGQSAIALQAGKDFTRMTGNSIHQVLTLIRFGRFEEVLEVKNRPQPIFAGGMWDFAQGYARLRTGEKDFAKLYLNRIRSVADTTQANFRHHKASQLLHIAAHILEGEIHRTEEDLDEALKSFQMAVSVEDSLGYDEPEPTPYDARHWLGAVLMEMERYPEAEQVYRTELKDHPNNGWSLYGLQQALKAQGKSSLDIDLQFEKSWARSDMWIRSSRF